MDDFTTRKVRKTTSRHYKIGASVLISIFIAIFLIVGIVQAISSIDFGVFLKLAGQELEKDAYGHTNFLLLGHGGKNHSGGDLMDTIIVASLDQEKNLVTMVSIPRDLYVQDNLVGSSRINEIYFSGLNYFDNETEAIEHMEDRVEEIVGLPIHYWVKVNFEGFKDMIDALGGVTVTVDEAIYDPYYPLDGTYEYTTFSLSKGVHDLDGETALKYARSRKTTSDFDRATRQQKILYAIKEKALSTKTVLSTDRIENLLNVLKENIDTNIKVKEILTLGSLAPDFSENSITHRLIHDDPSRCGGLLYTPDRSLYSGAYVLIPAGGDKFLHLYSDLNFNYPQAAHSDTTIHILNGSSKVGVAAETKQILRRFCFNINRFGNAATTDLTQTTYYYKQKTNEKGKPIDSRPPALDFLQKIIPGRESTEIPADYQEYINDTDLILEIGSDYTSSPNYLEDSFYSLILNTPSNTGSEASDSNSPESSTGNTESTDSEATPPAATEE